MHVRFSFDVIVLEFRILHLNKGLVNKIHLINEKRPKQILLYGRQSTIPFRLSAVQCSAISRIQSSEGTTSSPAES